MPQIEKGAFMPISQDSWQTRVSILMPAFNAGRTLRKTVASVTAQGVQDWELLIVDDASRDDTYGAGQDLAKADPRIRLFRHATNQGAAAARNTALSKASGRYIAFLDADDLWLPDKLERQLAFMDRTGAALSYTGFWRARPDGTRHPVQVPASVDRQTLLKGNVIGCLTALYDRQQLGDCPMPALPLRQDFALWLDILTRTRTAHGLQDPLAVHCQRAGSLSANRLRATRATWAMYRQHLGLGPLTSARYLANHLLRRLQRG